MRGDQRPNWWAIGILVFCLGVWGGGVVGFAKTAHIYTHRSPAGFRHDLVAHARVHWRELKKLVDTPPAPVAPPPAQPI